MVSQVADQLTCDQTTCGLNNMQSSELADFEFDKITFRVIIYFKFAVRHFSEFASLRIVQS